MRDAVRVLIMSSVFVAGAARADDAAPTAPTAPTTAKDTCIAAFDRGQTSQSSRKLRAARTDLVMCASEACPDLIREDCARSLLAVDAAMPTVVFTVTKLGVDQTEFRVLVDGVLVTETEGRAVGVDPGPHSARFEVSGQGPIEVPFVAREGEKNRLLSAKLPEPKATAESREGRRVPIVPIVLVTTGALALGGALLLRIRVDGDADDLRATCAPACDQGARDALSSKLVVSNVAFAVGLGALALSAVTWLLEPHR